MQKGDETMKKTSLLAGCAAILVVALVSGCTSDLLPVPGPVGIDWCRIDPGTGELIVEVRNNGPAAAPASTTRVDFLGFGGSDEATSPIPAGTSTIVGPIPFPLGCFNPDCNFRINVDFFDAITETDEANNEGEGYCIG
jgi:hypothetical protein